jgi:hypothetical protein
MTSTPGLQEQPMKIKKPPIKKSPVDLKSPFKRLEPELPTDADPALLLSFRANLAAEQTHNQLRVALLDASFRAPLARYLIRSSGILRRVSRNQYRLRAYRP